MGKNINRRTLTIVPPVAAICVFLSASGSAMAADEVAASLRVGIVQMSTAPTLSANRDRILAGVAQAAGEGVRVAVFPEGVLRGEGGDDEAAVEQAMAAVRQAARQSNLYVVLGGWTWSRVVKKNANWMAVVDPHGREIFRYDKLYDNHRAKMPGVFHIDGIACSTMICADRWLRGVAEIPIHQGAQISFELSNNFASEWVAPLGWYWYVPRALRNNVWVVFANSGNAPAESPIARADLRHGHSAVIAPDGQVVASAPDEAETLVVAELELRQATRSEALARAAHPALRPFWEAGLKLQQGQKVESPPLARLDCEPATITLAASQVIDDPAAMEAAIEKARARGADLVAFPERAVDEGALERLQTAARRSRITVVFGTEHREGTVLYNSALVLGPDGSVLTRYDQLSAGEPYQAGASPATMWFRVKGVPAVVSVDRDALWTEFSELAAVAGARIHVHLEHDPIRCEGPGGKSLATSATADGDLRRLQVWSNLASYLTFTATVNVTASALWDDLRGMEETRAEVRGLPRPDTGPVEVYSPFSANLVVRAKDPTDLLVATRHISGPNPYHPSRTASFNPQMDPWYRLGAELITKHD